MKYSKLRFYQLILTAELALFLLLNSHCEAATKKMFSGIAEPEKVTASISDWRENVNVFGGKLLETRVLVDQTADVSGLQYAENLVDISPNGRRLIFEGLKTLKVNPPDQSPIETVTKIITILDLDTMESQWIDIRFQKDILEYMKEDQKEWGYTTGMPGCARFWDDNTVVIYTHFEKCWKHKKESEYRHHLITLKHKGDEWHFENSTTLKPKSKEALERSEFDLIDFDFEAVKKHHRFYATSSNLNQIDNLVTYQSYVIYMEGEPEDTRIEYGIPAERSPWKWIRKEDFGPKEKELINSKNEESQNLKISNFKVTGGYLYYVVSPIEDFYASIASSERDEFLKEHKGKMINYVYRKKLLKEKLGETELIGRLICYQQSINSFSFSHDGSFIFSKNGSVLWDTTQKIGKNHNILPRIELGDFIPKLYSAGSVVFDPSNKLRLVGFSEGKIYEVILNDEIKSQISMKGAFMDNADFLTLDPDLKQMQETVELEELESMGSRLESLETLPHFHGFLTWLLYVQYQVLNSNPAKTTVVGSVVEKHWLLNNTKISPDTRIHIRFLLAVMGLKEGVDKSMVSRHRPEILELVLNDPSLLDHSFDPYPTLGEILITNDAFWEQNDRAKANFLDRCLQTGKVPEHFQSVYQCEKGMVMYKADFKDEGLSLIESSLQKDPVGVEKVLGSRFANFCKEQKLLQLLGRLYISKATSASGFNDKDRENFFKAMSGYCLIANQANQPLCVIEGIEAINRNYNNRAWAFTPAEQSKIEVFRAIALCLMGKEEDAYKSLLNFGALDKSVVDEIMADQETYALLFLNKNKAGYILGVDTSKIKANPKMPEEQSYLKPDGSSVKVTDSGPTLDLNRSGNDSPTTEQPTPKPEIIILD